ncbi:MAG: ADP-glyceromanno-heptose 6-epimerase [Nanoarchaeota archaeon]|nr:ADP-glyceromanno-heptose 6-epimerase [Nanoarchaeota archaeon]
MKILVTGAAGFIGSNIAKELASAHHVVGIDDFSTGTFENLLGFKGQCYAQDIRTVDFEEFSPEMIFHEAAITDTRVSDQRLMIEVNVNSFRRMLEFACPRKITVIYASSAAVYGNGKSPMRENQALGPLNVYGFSKLMMDHIAKEYSERFPKSVIIGLRYFNVFGPGESHKKGYCSMISQLHSEMHQGRRPKIFKAGEQTRDHIYVKDVVQANLVAMNQNKSGTYNVGTGVETSFNQIIGFLNSQIGSSLKPEYIDNPYPFYQNKTRADISQLSGLGFAPKFTVETGIKDYFKHAE